MENIYGLKWLGRAQSLVSNFIKWGEKLIIGLSLSRETSKNLDWIRYFLTYGSDDILGVDVGPIGYLGIDGLKEGVGTR